jgi:hypothetical protein
MDKVTRRMKQEKFKISRNLQKQIKEKKLIIKEGNLPNKILKVQKSRLHLQFRKILKQIQNCKEKILKNSLYQKLNQMLKFLNKIQNQILEQV